jgi:hypothetical protein
VQVNGIKPSYPLSSR